MASVSVWVKELWANDEWHPTNSVVVRDGMTEREAREYLLSARQEQFPNEYRVREYVPKESTDARR